MQSINEWLSAFASFVWGPPLVVLLLGGGTLFLLYSRFLPYRYIPHALVVLAGRYDDDRAPGQLTHFQALSAALAGTIGLGNIAGVAVAVELGGPGAVFWMWMTAVVGVATKFFTCTLAILYRGRDETGELRGGPMYVIVEGLGARFKPLAVFFCIAGLIGCLPALQVNQMVQTTAEFVLTPLGWQQAWVKPAVGLLIAIPVALVILGDIRRVGRFSAALVPSMSTVYVLAVIGIIVQFLPQVPAAFTSIFVEAFNVKSAVSGGLMGVILIGVRRGLFSNEAGIGTEVMAHGAAKTTEPVREGMVAMLGPIIDTLIICTATALIILCTGALQLDGVGEGASLTAAAFAVGYGEAGRWLLYGLVMVFGFTTTTSYWFYGTQCWRFLAGAHRAHWYRYFYLLTIVGIAALPLGAVLNLIDGMYALMAIPTMLSTMILAPRVMRLLADYRLRTF